jgi:hypothetical protein
MLVDPVNTQVLEVSRLVHPSIPPVKELLFVILESN